MRADEPPEVPAHDDTARVLLQAGVTTAAAEVHGIITGVLCAPNGARVAWQELALGRAPSPDAATELMSVLTTLHRATQTHLSGLECDFSPLLPGEAHSLPAQIEGLSDWCRGFLLGLHAGGVPEASQVEGDAGEIIRDIGRIAEAELDENLAEEAEARALTEIVEYLRVGVQLVYEEFQAPSAT